MKRRGYFLFISLFSLVSLSFEAVKPLGDRGFIMTVNGKLATAKMGLTMPHEHIVTDFGGAAEKDVTYNNTQAIKLFLPYLKHLKANDVKTMVECTPSYIGKNVQLLKKLSVLSGLQIITNTGYYAAVGQKYLPKHAFTESAETLATRWTNDYLYGIERTGVRPGFIKLGTDAARLNEIAIKLIKAGAIAHIRTGLKIAIHTGNAEAALIEADIIDDMGVDLSAFIWVHAQNDRIGNTQLALAKKGVWISLDGVNEQEASLSLYIESIRRMKSAKLLHRLLLSQDDGFAVSLMGNKPKFEAYANGNKIPYNTILSILKPRLLKGILTKDEFDLVTIKNPAQAYKIEILNKKR